MLPTSRVPGTCVICDEPAVTRVVAAGSVVSCPRVPSPAAACGVASRVATASHFASQECRHYRLDAKQARPDDANWTGAEIQSCCRLASLLDVPLVQAAQNVVPVAVTAGDKIEGLRQWASGRCLSADRAGVYSRSEASGGGRVRKMVREQEGAT